MKYVVVTSILLLAVVHQDFWWWDDKTPIFGFLPIGLAWHAGISLAAGLVGWVAVTFCWPHELDEPDNGAGSTSSATGKGAQG